MKLHNLAALATAAVLFQTWEVHAENLPKVIRVGYPGVGVGGRPVVGGSVLAYVANKGLLEDEFRKDGVEVKWSYFLQAGPALNESYANNLIDVGLLGDLPAVVGKASGLDSRIVLGGGRNVATAVVVPSDSRIASIGDLKGKRVGIFKGTNIQVSASRILSLNGLSERDLRVVNLNAVAQQAALAAKDIEAIFTSVQQGIIWEDQGIGKIIYRTDKDPKASNFGTNYTIIASQKFIDKYPSVVQRYVNVILKASALQSDPKNRDDFFKEWAKSGSSQSSYKRAWANVDLDHEQSPLLDAELKSIYKAAEADIRKYGLSRRTFDLNAWFDERFLNQGLKELGLENHWKAY